MKLSQVDEIRMELDSILYGEFNIQHVTLQFEFNPGHPAKVISQEHNS